MERPLSDTTSVTLNCIQIVTSKWPQAMLRSPIKTQFSRGIQGTWRGSALGIWLTWSTSETPSVAEACKRNSDAYYLMGTAFIIHARRQDIWCIHTRIYTMVNPGNVKWTNNFRLLGFRSIKVTKLQIHYYTRRPKVDHHKAAVTLQY